jgi:hypothetical protein
MLAVAVNESPVGKEASRQQVTKLHVDAYSATLLECIFFGLVLRAEKHRDLRVESSWSRLSLQQQQQSHKRERVQQPGRRTKVRPFLTDEGQTGMKPAY